MVGGTAHIPFIGLRTINQIPTIGACLLKIAAIGHFGGKSCQGGSSQRSGTAVVAAAVGIDIEIVGRSGVKTINGSAGHS